MLSNDYFKPQTCTTMEFTDLKLTQFTETQKELMQKFNMAFYEAQSKSMEREILENFDEKYFNDIENYEEEETEPTEDILEFLLPKNESYNENTEHNTEINLNFDYGDFSETFEKVHNKEITTRRGSVSTETVLSTEYSYLDGILRENNKLQLSEIDLSESLSNSSSLDFDNLDNFEEIIDFNPNNQEKIKLPSVETIKNFKFNQIIRQSDPDSLENPKINENLSLNLNLNSNFGHLIGQEVLNNNQNYIFNHQEIFNEENQVLMNQNEALIYDDPLLSSTNIINSKKNYQFGCSQFGSKNNQFESKNNQFESKNNQFQSKNNQFQSKNTQFGQKNTQFGQKNHKFDQKFKKDDKNRTEIFDEDEINELNEINEEKINEDDIKIQFQLQPCKLQCKWEDCYQIYNSQTALVKHIEKNHVELKRGEEFTCFWINCPRKSKPFNARYKLLIHMRVHSGEKPNKCPFQGCNKAFSRLENLKIHQRSHTGERPYLCQFSNCFKSFSNSSDRAKHQRTHFDTKPYACQVTGCLKKYTDPSSLRKHVKNHSVDEQLEVKRKSMENKLKESYTVPKKVNINRNQSQNNSFSTFYTSLDHNYSNSFTNVQNIKNVSNIKQDLKLKLNEKFNKKSEKL